MTIKAIETVYNGYRFRSRLEARWAVFFDVLGIKYEYEPEGFDLGDAGWYLPDFWLPDWSTWIEVKPTAPTPDELRKIITLSDGRDEYGFVLFGSPGPIKIEVDYDTSQWHLDQGALMVGQMPTKNQAGEPVPFYDPTVKAWAETQGGTNLDIWPFYTTALPVLRFLADDVYVNLYIAPVFPNGFIYRGYDGDGVDFCTPRLLDAYQEARGARFEHGETPRVA